MLRYFIGRGRCYIFSLFLLGNKSLVNQPINTPILQYSNSPSHQFYYLPTMDRLLRPKVFETTTSDPCAEKLYRHWKMTFVNYIEESVPAVAAATPGDEASIAAAATAIASRNRKIHFALINNISADIYELISECNDYQSSMAVLDAAYIRPTSTVYNRHKLMTSKQEPGQSVDSFKQELERLSKSCNFQAVTAEENKNQSILIAFIQGISSPQIRQRLLENIGDLSLEQAFAQARQLEQAQNQSASYDNSTVAAVPDQSDDELAAMSLNSNSNKLKTKLNPSQQQNNGDRREPCFFCGRSRHPRSQCPARDSQCRNCGKKGHWKEVCNSGRTLPVGAIGPQHDQDQPNLA